MEKTKIKEKRLFFNKLGKFVSMSTVDCRVQGNLFIRAL